jgi:hypothetical protein
MSLHTTLPLSGDLRAGLTRGFDGCTCACHRMEGVFHCVPCCGPARQGAPMVDQPAAQCDWDAWKAAREVA